jgi:hypothetical protein
MHIAKWLPLLLLLIASTSHAQSTASDLAAPTAPEEAAQADVPAPPETSSEPAPVETRSARTEEPVVTPASSYAQDVDAGVARRLELESINSQQNAANALYVTSAILAVLGTGALAGGMIDIISSLGRGSSTSVAGYLIVAGGVLNVGHVVTMIIAACLDYGSGSHRRKLLRDHPELAFELSPGPGDAGLGLTLRF